MATYAIIDLGTLGGSQSSAFGLNNNTQVVGRSSYSNSNDEHAFLWINGNMTDLGTLGGAESVAVAINDQGKIAGSSDIAGKSHAFMYENGIITDLNPLLSSSTSTATDINRTGQIVGGADFGITGNEEYMHAFLFDSKNNKVKDLGTLPGRERSVAMAINDKSQVVGGSRHAGVADSHPFLYDNNQMIDLSPNSLGTAWGINNLGHVVGSLSDKGAFIYSNGQLQYMNFNGLAYAINDAGQAVGSGSPGAWIWTKQSGMKTLNSLIPANSGWDLTAAYNINEQGEIVGVGMYQGHAHGYLLVDPNKPGVPPPLHIDEKASALILFGVTKDGGGLVIKPGGTPQPIDPWGPLRQDLQAAAREMLLSAMLSTTASLIGNTELRRQLQEIAAKLDNEATKKNQV